MSTCILHYYYYYYYLFRDPKAQSLKTGSLAVFFSSSATLAKEKCMQEDESG